MGSVALEGWLPECLKRMGWRQALHCTEVFPVSSLKQTGSDGRA